MKDFDAPLALGMHAFMLLRPGALYQGTNIASVDMVTHIDRDIHVIGSLFDLLPFAGLSSMCSSERAG